MNAHPFHQWARRILAAALSLTALSALGATPAPAGAGDGFSRGNQCYAAGKFREAADAYEAAARGGDYRANLFYNLGDAYYRLGSRGRAILNYRRALLLEPAHAEAAANLAFVGGGPPPAARKFSPTTGFLCWLGAAGTWFVVGGLMAAWLSRRRRRPALTMCALGLAVAVPCAAWLWQAAPAVPGLARAVVIVADAAAHYSPADNAKVVTKLPEGAEVRILSAQGAWTYALLGDGTRAWVASDALERLVPAR